MAGVTAPVDRVMAVSDIHVDMAENMAWLRALSRAHYARSALILAGDVADDLGVLGDALGHARRTFAGGLLRAGQSRAVGAAASAPTRSRSFAGSSPRRTG
jgi:hypothetical protein